MSITLRSMGNANVNFQMKQNWLFLERWVGKEISCLSVELYSFACLWSRSFTGCCSQLSIIYRVVVNKFEDNERRRDPTQPYNLEGKI